MARIEFDKDSEEFRTFTEFWAIFKEYGQPEDNDDYWDSLMKALNVFHIKHNKSLLAYEISMMLATYLEKKFKKEKGDV